MTTNVNDNSHLDDLEHLNFQQLQKVLPASAMSYWRWERKGILTPIRIGKRRFWRCADIKRLLKEGANV